jgi:uncharacterized protein
MSKPDTADLDAYIERLEAAHEFPCRYTFKVIARNGQDVVEAARAVVLSVFPEVIPETSRRESSRGRHQSITLIVPVPDARSVARIYQRLHALVGVHMVL